MNNVLERDPRNYNEAMRSRLKAAWLKAIVKEIIELEANGVWEAVR